MGTLVERAPMSVRWQRYLQLMTSVAPLRAEGQREKILDGRRFPARHRIGKQAVAVAMEADCHLAEVVLREVRLIVASCSSTNLDSGAKRLFFAALVSDGVHQIEYRFSADKKQPTIETIRAHQEAGTGMKQALMVAGLVMLAGGVGCSNQQATAPQVASTQQPRN